MGADSILWILAALEDAEGAALEQAAQELGMDVLLEVHDEEELERALKLSSPLVGINNRNLRTLEISLETTKRPVPLLPSGKEAVCESGIRSHADILSMQEAGISRLLVGESLMRQPDGKKATLALLGKAV